MESAKKEFGLGNNESPEEYMKNQAIEDMAKRPEAKKVLITARHLTPLKRVLHKGMLLSIH